MPYSPELAAALSGASVRRLAYWRSARTAEPLLEPEHWASSRRISYSFRDVVALRSVVYLRTAGISLQRMRKAIATLRQMGEVQHLSTYELVPVGKNVDWVTTNRVAYDLTGLQGAHGVLISGKDIFNGFLNEDDVEIPPLLHPGRGVEIDPEVRSGYPVIEGTRVPFDAVASLVEDGVPVERIGDYYPSVTADSAEGATAFSRYVATYRSLVLSAS